jgi:hypothetical protein
VKNQVQNWTKGSIKKIKFLEPKLGVLYKKKFKKLESRLEVLLKGKN